jgi:hypothetical protein
MAIGLIIDHRRTRYAAFLLLAVAINAIDSTIVRTVADPARRMVVSAAATLDLVVVVCAIYYWLLVRPGIRGRVSLIPIALLGVLRATFLYPNARTLAAFVAGACEVALIAFVVIQVRARARRNPGKRDGDPVDLLHASLQPILPGAARFLAAELSIFYYALFSWRAKPYVPQGAQAFSLHKKSGHADLLYIVALASTMEIVPLHLLLRHWSLPAAWIATSLSLYGMIWLIGLARSIALRPVLVGPDSLDIKFGLLFRLRVPRESIAAVHIGPADGATVIPRRSTPNVCIEFVSVLDAEGPLGLRRPVRQLALSADDPADFEKALRALID